MLYSLLIKSAHLQLQQVKSASCVGKMFQCSYWSSAVVRSAAAVSVRSVRAARRSYLLGIYRHSASKGHFKREFSLDASLSDRVKNNEKGSGQVSTLSKSRGDVSHVSAAQKVKEAGRDFTYLIVVLIGIGVTGGLLYVVFKELFSSSSPSKIYGKALEKCRTHPEIIGAFGEPIKGYGETTRRGRRQQVSHVEYLRDGVKHMRLKFYIEGSEPHIQGTVHTEVKENPETGKYEFRYIFVDIDTYPRRTIVVEDSR